MIKIDMQDILLGMKHLSLGEKHPWELQTGVQCALYKEGVISKGQMDPTSRHFYDNEISPTMSDTEKGDVEQKQIKLRKAQARFLSKRDQGKKAGKDA